MTFDLVFARPALTGMATPGAVGGEPVEVVIKADLRAKPGGEPGKPVLAAPSAEVAADPHHDPREFGEALDHRQKRNSPEFEPLRQDNT